MIGTRRPTGAAGQPPLSSGKPARPTERHACAACASGHLAEQLGLHGHDLAGLDPQGLVRSAAAGKRTPARPISRGQTLGAGPGVPHFRQLLHQPAVPDPSRRPPPHLPLAVVDPAPTDLLPFGRRPAALTRVSTKSESGCSDHHGSQSSPAAERETPMLEKNWPSPAPEKGPVE